MVTVRRKMGVSEPTFYRWKKQFVGMGVPEIRRLKQLDEENSKLKRLVANLILRVVDCHTREALSLTPRANFRAFQVTEALDALVRLRGRPKSLRVDNGPEFAGRMLVA